MSTKQKPKASKNKANDVEGVKMKLGIMDRLAMTSDLLPKEGDIVSLTIARDIRQKVGFQQAEMEKIGMKTREGGGLEWKEEGKKKEFSFTNAEKELLKTQVSSLDKQKKITKDLLPMCLMIRE